MTDQSKFEFCNGTKFQWSNQGLNLILVGSIENTNQRGRLNNQKVIDKEETRC